MRRFVTGFYQPHFRDLFFQPERWPAGFRSVVTVLAGNDRPPFSARWRIQAFFALVGIQKHFELVPRLHRKNSLAERAVAADEAQNSPTPREISS